MAAIKIIKNGKPLTFIFDDDWSELTKPSHPVFQAIENWGQDYIQSGSSDLQSMYYDKFEDFGGSYLSVKGAVQEAVGMMVEWMEENNRSGITLTESTFYNMELDIAFQAP